MSLSGKRVFLDFTTLAIDALILSCPFLDDEVPARDPQAPTSLL